MISAFLRSCGSTTGSHIITMPISTLCSVFVRHNRYIMLVLC